MPHRNRNTEHAEERKGETEVQKESKWCKKKTSIRVTQAGKRHRSTA